MQISGIGGAITSLAAIQQTQVVEQQVVQAVQEVSRKSQQAQESLPSSNDPNRGQNLDISV